MPEPTTSQRLASELLTRAEALAVAQQSLADAARALDAHLDDVHGLEDVRRVYNATVCEVERFLAKVIEGDGTHELVDDARDVVDLIDLAATERRPEPVTA